MQILKAKKKKKKRAAAAAAATNTNKYANNTKTTFAKFSHSLAYYEDRW